MKLREITSKIELSDLALNEDTTPYRQFQHLSPRALRKLIEKVFRNIELKNSDKAFDALTDKLYGEPPGYVIRFCAAIIEEESMYHDDDLTMLETALIQSEIRAEMKKRVKENPGFSSQPAPTVSIKIDYSKVTDKFSVKISFERNVDDSYCQICDSSHPAFYQVINATRDGGDFAYFKYMQSFKDDLLSRMGLGSRINYIVERIE